MFVQRTLRFSKRCHCGTKNKKARVIFLTNVNRCCAREFTVGHWNKMWGEHWIPSAGCLRPPWRVKKRRHIDWSLPRELCDRSLKLFGFN